MKRIVWLFACLALVSVAGSACAPSATTAGAAGETCANQNAGKAVPAVPRLANPKTARHAKYRFSFDYPSSWFDGTDMSEVPAGGVLHQTTLPQHDSSPLTRSTM